jgi:uncharacterized RDD family membrane protein YckC
MSQDGDPPDAPEPDATSSGGERPWSPYPDNWDTLTTQPQPASSFGRHSAGAEAQPVTPPPNPYGGTAAATEPAFGFGGFASWLSRVGAYLIDYTLGSIAGFPLWIGYLMQFSSATTTTDSTGVEHFHLHRSSASLALILIGSLTSLAFFIWNVYIRQGRTGASLGKSVLGLRLVNKDLQPIGAGWAFVRNLLHIVDALPCCLGYLWPIWDSQRQTFADKIMDTLVIHATKRQPRVF